jgi:hypothetical protein
MGKGFRFFGVLFFLIGATVLFNSFQGITGYAVYEGVNLNAGYYIAAWFILLGILLVGYRKREIVNNEKEIIGKVKKGRGDSGKKEEVKKVGKKK